MDKSWKSNNYLKENNSWDSWEHKTYKDSPTEYWTYEANDIITIRICKDLWGKYQGTIEPAEDFYMEEELAKTKEYASLDECREALIELVREMCSGFDFL